MPRAGLTYEKVVQVIRDLENRGEKPTINRVRQELGSGSPNTISQFIKAWREGKTDVEASKPAAQKPAEAVAQQKTDVVQAVEVVEVGALDSTVASAQQADSKSQPEVTEPKTDNRQQARSQGGRRIFNKRNNHQNNHHNRRQHHHQNNQSEPAPTYDVLSLERLEKMTQSDLIKHIKRLESILYKEQIRRESCEKMANEASHYAEIIKEQVALRISDLKQNGEVALEQLKLEMQQIREQAEHDLLFYRQQLDKANHKLRS